MPYETMMHFGIGLAVVLCIISVFLFFRLKIAHVIGYLSGHTAAKEIRQMQAGGSEPNGNHTGMKKEAGLPQPRVSGFKKHGGRIEPVDDSSATKPLSETKLEKQKPLLKSSASAETVLLKKPGKAANGPDSCPGSAEKINSGSLQLRMEADETVVGTSEQIEESR